MRNDVLSAQVQMAAFQSQFDKVYSTLPAQVAAMTDKLDAVSRAMTRLNLERFVSEVHALNISTKAAVDQVLLVRSSVTNAQKDVIALLPKIAQFQTAVDELSSYNVTVWSGLQAWSSSFKNAFRNYGKTASTLC